MLETFLIYNLILFLSTICIFLAEKTKNNYLKFFLISVSFLIIFLPAAFRYNIGQDYWSYVNIYNAVGRGEDVSIEFGTKLIMEVLNYNNINVEFFFFFTSFLIYFVYFLSLPKNGAAIYHCVYMMTYYFVTYNLIRSAIAFSFILLLLKCLIERRSGLIAFFVFICALSFHKSSVLILLVLPFLFLDLKGIFKYFYVKISLVIFLLILFFFRFAVVDFVVDLGLLDILNYDDYFNSPYFFKVEFNTGVVFFVNFFILLLPVIFLSKSLSKNDVFDNLIIGSIVMLLVATIMAAAIGIFSRLQRFFQYAILFIPLCFMFYKNKTLKWSLLLLFLLWYFVLFELNIYKLQSDVCSGARISPYVSIFNKEDDRSWAGISEGDCL